MDKYIKYYFKLFKDTLKETHKRAKQQILCDNCKPMNQPKGCERVFCKNYKFAVKSYKRKTVSETFFDNSLGEYVNSKDIDKICKEKGMVYGTIDETDKQAKYNKSYNIQNREREASKQLENDLRSALG